MYTIKFFTDSDANIKSKTRVCWKMNGQFLEKNFKGFGKYFPLIFQIINTFDSHKLTTMLKILLGQLFEQIENEPDNDRKSKNGNAAYFIEKILEEKHKKYNLISQRGLKDYFDKYVNGKKNKAGEPSSELKNVVAQYLGYTNYLDFEKKNEKKRKKGIFTINFKWLSLVGFILVIITILFYSNYFPSEDCIVWEIDHYEKVNCEDKTPNRLFKDVNIERFKKVAVSDTTTFFIKNQPIIWYGKSVDGTFEYFNSRGIHPKTMKELKPVTEYIINKYVKRNDSL